MKNFNRNCPKCKKTISYSSKYTLKTAIMKNSLCKGCAIKNRITEEDKIKMSLRIRGSNNPMYGKIKELNSFYGKTHTSESKQKIRESREKNKHIYTTPEFRTKISYASSGEKNPMYGKSCYDIWKLKYGEKIADEKLMDLKNKLSKANSGKNNPMYGKPAPIKSGNGWSGWYNSWYFRSLLELSYMINIIEKHKLNWQSAEIKKLGIPYIYKNTNRTYFADFLLNEKYLIEIKPRPLWDMDLNKTKRKFAMEFCTSNNLTYKLKDPKIIDNKILIDLYKNNKLKFTEKWDKKFNDLYGASSQSVYP